MMRSIRQLEAEERDEARARILRSGNLVVMVTPGIETSQRVRLLLEEGCQHRIATARDILYSAAQANRELSATEMDRIDQLVAAATLDARSALVQTQARAVQTKLAELQGQLAASGQPQTEVSP